MVSWFRSAPPSSPGRRSPVARKLLGMFSKMKRMLDQTLDRLESKFEGVSDDDVDDVIAAVHKLIQVYQQ